MKKLLPCLLFLIVTILLCCGCSANYQSVNFQTMNYSANSLRDSVHVEYNSNILLESSNLRYNSYAVRNNVTLLALKIKNNTPAPILINKKNLRISEDGRDVRILDVGTVVSAIHQPGYWYMLWSILFLNIGSTTTDENGQVDSSGSIPIPIGFIIGLANTSKSISADKRFREQMMQSDLIGKTMEPGEERTGIVSLYGVYRNDIDIKYVKE